MEVSHCSADQPRHRRATMMLASGERIPLEGVHEVPVIQALVEQRRRFVKPLRDDARLAAVFPSALPVDAGPAPSAASGQHVHGAGRTGRDSRNR